MRFEEEEVRAVALGTGWVAAVTSCNFLRIFTEGGLQVYIFRYCMLRVCKLVPFVPSKIISLSFKLNFFFRLHVIVRK